MTTLSPRAIHEKLALLLSSVKKEAYDNTGGDDGTIGSSKETLCERMWIQIFERVWNITGKLRNVLLLLALQKEAYIYDTIKDEEETLCGLMWKQTDKLRNLALKTKFVQEIKTGMLDPVAFGGYIGQEALCCQQTLKDLETAASKCDEKDLKRFLEEKAASYKKYYEEMFRDLQIDDRGIRLGNACQNYVNVSNNTARNCDPIYLLVASIPSARLWPWIGMRLKDGPTKFGFYNAWVGTNFNADSISYKKYEEIVNNHPRIDKKDALSLYTKCMALEVGLFASAEEAEKIEKYYGQNILKTEMTSEQPKTKLKTERDHYISHWNFSELNHPFFLWRHRK